MRSLLDSPEAGSWQLVSMQVPASHLSTPNPSPSPSTASAGTAATASIARLRTAAVSARVQLLLAIPSDSIPLLPATLSPPSSRPQNLRRCEVTQPSADIITDATSVRPRAHVSIGSCSRLDPILPHD